MALDLLELRPRFPALNRIVDGRPAAFLDGPGGTQVPRSVINAMAASLEHGGANLDGHFVTSYETAELVARARRAVADLFNADPSEIVFGQNMTSLTFAVSRALARTWKEGDQIVVTRLDHDANITPWTTAAAERGAELVWVDFDPADCTLDLAGLESAVGPRTRLVAVTAASNAVGTVVDVARAARAAHSVGALIYVDGVHYTPHALVDVLGWDVDFFTASAYKFFGPHTGMLYGKAEHLEALDAYKVRPAPGDPPGKWETGTQSFESLAGVAAAVDYLAGLGTGDTRRDHLATAMTAIGDHETSLTEQFLKGVAALPSVQVYGITDGSAPRTPTFALSVGGWHAELAAAELGRRGIFVWSGHYYAVAVMERLGLLEEGGLVRIGFVHYNSHEEVDRVLRALEALTA